MKAALAVPAALLIASLAGAALAKPPRALDRVQAGKAVAAHFCAECHAVDGGGVSQLRQAPPMPELYRTFPVERIDEALQAGLIDDHSQWLMTKLDARERKALTEYLSSFAPQGRDVAPPPIPVPPLSVKDLRIAGL